MTRVNLLSPTFIAKRDMRRALELWGTIGAVGLVVVVGWAVQQYATRQQIRDHLEIVRLQHAQHETATSEIKQLKEQRALLALREQATFDLEDEIPLLDLLGIVGHAAKTSNDMIHVERFEFTNNAVPRKSQREAAASLARRMNVIGIAADNVAIARFAAAIRDANVFDSVELESTGSVTTENAKSTSRSFSIHCSLPLAQFEEAIQ